MSQRPRRFATLLGLALAASCGGGPSGPTALAQAVTYPVAAMVFYDENRNGVLDPAESVRLPNVAVSAAGVSSRTSAGGVAMLSVPGGEQRLAIVADSLPAFYQPGPPAAILVPVQSQALLPVTLPLGTDVRPNSYMAFGDSITVGEGSGDGLGRIPCHAARRLPEPRGRDDTYSIAPMPPSTESSEPVT